MPTAGLARLGRILLAQVHRHAHRRRPWVLWLMGGLLALPPAGCLLFAPAHPVMWRVTGFCAALMIGVGLFGAWFEFASGVFDQNLPSAARLVPNHRRSLQLALLFTWASLSALAAGLSMLAFAALPVPGHPAPLEVATIAAAVLVAIAVLIRWQRLGIPLLVAWIAWKLAMPKALIAAAAAAWSPAAFACAALVFGVGGLLLAALVRGGGVRHAAAHERYRVRRERARAGEFVREDIPISRPLPFASFAAQRTLLVRADVAPVRRAVIALGTGGHWRDHVGVQMAVAVAAAIVLVAWYARGTSVPAQGFFFMIAGGTAFVLPMRLFAGFDAMRRRPREQALLSLLPGMPRGAALSRALAFEMSRNFLATLVSASVLLEVLVALAMALGLFAPDRVVAALPAIVAMAGLPFVAPIWRNWGAAAPSGPFIGAMRLFAPASLFGLVLCAVDFGEMTPLQVAVPEVAVVFACCAWRWRRMASEPAAFPVGRHAASG